MTLLLSDEQFNDPKQVRYLSRGETFCRSYKCPPVRLFAELKRCNGACNKLPFIGLQNIGKAARNTARMQGVMFEMIQPDFEISSTHAATLPIALHRVWEFNRAVQWRNSGGLWRLRSPALPVDRAIFQPRRRAVPHAIFARRSLHCVLPTMF